MDGKDERDVEDFYDLRVGNEWQRLSQDFYHSLEFRTTMHFLRKHLPPPALVLDCGGGPGRYAIALAELGFEVVLLDLSSRNLEFARVKCLKLGVSGVRQFVKASAVSLPFSAEAFDGVLIAGPLYHLVSLRERRKAMKEGLRVLKKSGIVAASIVSLHGVFRSALVEFPAFLKSGRALAYLRRPMQRKSAGDDVGAFTTAYFGDILELEEQFNSLGAETLELVALEGLASGLREPLNQLAEEGHGETWWKIHLATCTHRTALGGCEHTLYLGRKR